MQSAKTKLPTFIRKKVTRMLRTLFLSAFFYLFCGLTHAATQGTNAIAHRDVSVIDIRHFNKSVLNEYRNTKDFQYGDQKLSVTPSLWSQFWKWFWSLFGDAFENAASGGVLKYVFTLLGGAAIIFLVVRLAGMDTSMIFSGRSEVIEVPYSESLENIHEISFDSAIEEAARRKDFRLAVRFLYLRTLKKLNDSGRISWKPDKTNSEYIKELRHPQQQGMFRSLTRQFEYVWYGSFEVDRNAFEKINASFSDFNRGRF